MNKMDPLSRFIIICFLIAVMCFTILFLFTSVKKEQVYIQEKSQRTEIFKEKEPAYIDVYTSPCKDNPELECVYITIYPNVDGMELERNECRD